MNPDEALPEPWRRFRFHVGCCGGYFFRRGLLRVAEGDCWGRAGESGSPWFNSTTPRIQPNLPKLAVAHD